jgi:hypothetical protein
VFLPRFEPSTSKSTFVELYRYDVYSFLALTVHAARANSRHCLFGNISLYTVRPLNAPFILREKVELIRLRPGGGLTKTCR